VRMLATIVLCGVFAAPAVAQLAASSGTNDVYYSDTHVAPARIKDVVMERQDDSGVSLMDRKRVFARLADLVAEQVTAEGAAEVADAWTRGFSNGVETLRAAFAAAPTNGIFVGLEIPYDTTASRSAVIDMYVVSNHYDAAANLDMFWIHFNRSIPRPAMKVPYVWGGTTQVVDAAWTLAGTSANYTNAYTLTRGGYTYDNCRLLFAERPAAITNAWMNLKRYAPFGDPVNGLDWGKVQTTCNGRSSITATLSDGTNDWQFVNGCLISKTPTEIPENE